MNADRWHLLLIGIDEVVKEALRRRALRHGRSMEEEVSLNTVGFGSGIAVLFSGAAQFES
ncbi:FitA-like ribbon-helix-helix domain-containing protein [Synechococcus lacustris]|uniref:FitA-like ribbon-helix-helix domain-containing protein n=1 Tax=Synechococcus lacustris TaxID=2116544 RepID=UPI0020CE0A7E|nr:hypothetical protein [Synechococcus lacustris L1F-Slac]